MTSLISSLVFVISANIDNIVLGLSLGIKKTKISTLKNIFISLLMSIITGFFMYLSNIINIFVNDTNFFKIIGSCILIAIGIYGILNFFIVKKSDTKEKTYSSNLNIKELICITIALASNNMAVGIIAGIAGISKIYTIIFTFFISFLFLFLGNKIGQNILNKFIQKYAEIFSCVLLTLLGVGQILIK